MTNNLIIHDSKSSMLLLRTYIMSELSDAVVSEASSIEQSEEILDVKKFEAIICGKQIIEHDSNGLINKIKSTNRNCPIILVTSESSQKIK